MVRRRGKRKSNIPGKGKAVISEEKMIEQMKKRKTQIFGLCINIVILCVAMVTLGIFVEKGLDRINDNDHWTEAVVETQNIPEAWAGLFSYCAMLAFATSAVFITVMVMACALGFVIPLLIGELTGRRSRRLIVSMWERIERLEKGVQEQGQENV